MGALKKKPFHIGASEAKVAAFEKINKENIWYKNLKDGRYEFRLKDIQRIKQIYGDEVNKIRPFGRSTHYHPEILSIIKKKLEEKNIPYKVRKFEGELWLVWEENNHDQVQKIADEASKEFSK